MVWAAMRWNMRGSGNKATVLRRRGWRASSLNLQPCQIACMVHALCSWLLSHRPLRRNMTPADMLERLSAWASRSTQ